VNELREKQLQEFTEYFVKNYPGPTTIISNPHWHAPQIFQAATRLYEQSQRDLDLEVLEARIGEVKSTRYVAARSANTGDVVLDCDKRIAQLETDLQKRKAQLPKT
jgi:hypothetical protein